MYSKHRLEALSDGIFAIAMTLLVLELKVPTGTAPGQLGHALLHDAHAWISFIVTFVITSVFWVMQHRVFEAVESIGLKTIVPTFFFLGLISLLPFSTGVWGQHLTEPLAFFLYFLNQFFLALALVIKLELARKSGHLHHTSHLPALRLRLGTMCITMAIAATSVWVFPIKYLGLVLAAFALLVRRLRAVLLRRLEVPAPASSPQP